MTKDDQARERIFGLILDEFNLTKELVLRLRTTGYSG